MTCNCPINTGAEANNSAGCRQNCECGSRCGCGSYYSNCGNCIRNNNTMGVGTAGLCGTCSNNQSMMFNSNASRLNDLNLATTYVLPQVYTQSYTPEESLERGTCFPELDIDY